MLREVNDWPKVTELLSDRSTILTQVFCLCAVSAAPRLHQLSSSHEHVQKSFGQLFFNSKGAKAITVASQWLVGDYFCKWLLTEESLLCVCVCVCSQPRPIQWDLPSRLQRPKAIALPKAMSNSFTRESFTFIRFTVNSMTQVALLHLTFSLYMP